MGEHRTIQPGDRFADLEILEDAGIRLVRRAKSPALAVPLPVMRRGGYGPAEKPWYPAEELRL